MLQELHKLLKCMHIFSSELIDTFVLERLQQKIDVYLLLNCGTVSLILVKISRQWIELGISLYKQVNETRTLRKSRLL